MILIMNNINNLTHPDYASLVDPLYFVKRVGNFLFFFNSPLFALAKRGMSSEA